MMQCRKGHWYDGSQYTRCPFCHPVSQSEPAPVDEDRDEAQDDDSLLNPILLSAAMEPLSGSLTPDPDPSPGFEGFSGGDSGGGGASDDFSGGSSDLGSSDSAG